VPRPERVRSCRTRSELGSCARPELACAAPRQSSPTLRPVESCTPTLEQGRRKIRRCLHGLQPPTKKPPGAPTAGPARRDEALDPQLDLHGQADLLAVIRAACRCEIQTRRPAALVFPAPGQISIRWPSSSSSESLSTTAWTPPQAPSAICQPGPTRLVRERQRDGD
jgi:hypothetical protein